MTINLEKGGNVNLTKEAPGLARMLIGLGWDARSTTGAEFDLDGSVFLLKSDGKVRTDQDFIFYNNLKSADDSVIHTGDNRTGEGDGDDESMVLDLNKFAAEVEKVAVGVTIHDASARQQNFGMVANAFIRCVNMNGDVEIARYDLSEEGSIETAMIFGEIYRHGGDWKFRAVGQGFKGGLGPLARSYGVDA